MIVPVARFCARANVDLEGDTGARHGRGTRWRLPRRTNCVWPKGNKGKTTRAGPLKDTAPVLLDNGRLNQPSLRKVTGTSWPPQNPRQLKDYT